MTMGSVSKQCNLDREVFSSKNLTTPRTITSYYVPENFGTQGHILEFEITILQPTLQDRLPNIFLAYQRKFPSLITFPFLPEELSKQTVYFALNF